MASSTVEKLKALESLANRLECELGPSEGSIPKGGWENANRSRRRNARGRSGVRDILNAELCALLWRSFLGLSLLGMLALINFNIQELLQCMLKMPSPSGEEHSTMLVPTGLNCTSKVYEDNVNHRLKVCSSQGAPVIAFYVNASMLRVYTLEETTAFVDWIRQCSGKDLNNTCSLHSAKSPTCPLYSYVNTPPVRMLCINANYEINYLVLETVKYSKSESVTLVEYVVTHPLLKML